MGRWRFRRDNVLVRRLVEGSMDSKRAWNCFRVRAAAWISILPCYCQGAVDINRVMTLPGCLWQLTQCMERKPQRLAPPNNFDGLMIFGCCCAWLFRHGLWKAGQGSA